MTKCFCKKCPGPRCWNLAGTAVVLVIDDVMLYHLGVRDLAPVEKDNVNLEMCLF